MPLRVLCAPNLLAAASLPPSLAWMLTMFAVSFQRAATNQSLELAIRDTMLSFRGSMFFISHDSQLYSTCKSCDSHVTGLKNVILICEVLLQLHMIISTVM